MPSSKTEFDILILGPVPPPFGGIAAHVSRLVPLLQNAGLRVGVLNHFSSTEMSFVLGALRRNPLNYYRLPKRFHARLLHYHHSRWSTLMAVAIGRGRTGTRYILTIHSDQLGNQLNSNVPLIGPLTRWALRRFDAIIVVNPKIRTAIQDHVGERRIEVVPAFLAGVGEESPYDVSTEAFLSSGRILLVPAYRVRPLRNGRDVYGLDTAVKAFVILAEQRPELRLAFFIAAPPSGGKASRYLSDLERRLAEAGLSERVLIAFGLPLTPALRYNVVMVRPTRADGDAVSVREALHAGVPVVASDAVERPSGTATFSVDDVRGLCTALRRILDSPTDELEQIRKESVDQAPDEPFLERLMRIYRAQLDSETPSPRMRLTNP
jgi:glycosyltransferase involved in cell wall biosynthesis